VRAIVLSFILTFSLAAARAGETQILNVVNEVDGSRFNLIIVTDAEDNAIGLKLHAPAESLTKSYNVSNLKDGVVLKQEGKHRVIVLSSHDFDKSRGGHFKMNYLSNGITGSRDEMEIEVDYDDGWKVFLEGEKIRGLRFEGRSVFGKVVGIKRVTAIK
jgi:hypothetical protein